MIGLGSIIDRVTGLFGKTYLLAGFFPVLLLAAVSLIAGSDTSPWISAQAAAFRELDAGRQALASGAAMVAVAMLGFIYWSANPWWRALLQGTALWEPVRQWMARDQQKQLDALEAELETCEARVFAFRTAFPDPEPEPEPAPPALPPPDPPRESAADRLVSWLIGEPAASPTPDGSTDGSTAAPATPSTPTASTASPVAASTAVAAPSAAPGPASAAPPVPWPTRLADARDRGEAQTGVAPVSPSIALREQYEAVRARIRGLALVEAGELDDLCANLEAELARAPVPAAGEMDALHVGFYHLAAQARARAENARNRALSVRRVRFPLDLAAVGPTRMANVAEIYRDHALARYQLDPELMWLQLQRSAAKDDQFRPILEEARLKLDVSVALAVACGLASLWAVAVGMAGRSLPVLLLTGAGLPAAALLFYRATITNLRVYGEAVAATVQLFRFDVLKALHLPLPADSDAERRLWETLTLTDQLLADEKLAYVHP
jgi:hypothetical protein